MIAVALLNYAVAAIIPIAVILVLFKFLKNKLNLSKLHAFFGGVAFIIAAIAALVLIKAAFSPDAMDYMTVYLPQWIYKTSVLFVIFIVICILRYVIVNAFYFSKENESKGTSFLVGFGMAGGLFTALYCLYCFAYITITALGSDFVTLSDNSLLVFEDSTVISVFYPFSQHIAVSLLFTVYSAFMLVWSLFMSRHSKYPFKRGRTFVICLVTLACEAIMLIVMLLSLSNLNLFVTLAICLLLCAASFACVNYLYKYNEVGDYENQFD